MEENTILVYKITPSYEPPASIDYFEVPISELGGSWVSFLQKTGFCRISPFHSNRNITARAGYRKPIYIVKGMNRSMIYDSNYQYGRERYLYVKQFVDYVLGRYKYKNIQ